MTAPLVLLLCDRGQDRYWEKLEPLDDDLQAHGFVTFTDTMLSVELSRGQYIGIASGVLKVADALVLLPGWEASDDCQLLEGLAEALNVPVFESVEKLCAVIPRPI